ncbi:nodulation protein NodH [Gemmobacter serpentinus]|uniref:nodulation protein NodH n=1 Tax=Gemmobacter serpentinus TaxID=2652247 RepID=UPI00299ECF1A|nr:nodulation protein NodH [Gemmobacter serpentinus]
MKFTSFVMFAEMRTGSNFLEANLNALPGVTCHGELFNPHFMGKRDNPEMFGFDLAAREADPMAVLAAMRDQTEGLAGFRIFHDHDARVIAQTLADPACAKIVLTRNPMESYVSLKIAQATDQWRLTNAKNLKTARVSFNAAEFEGHLQAVQDFQIDLMRGLQISGQTAFYIDYEDLNDLEVLNGLAAFLGLEARLEALDPKLKKQNPDAAIDKVLNPAEMETSLSRLDRFNLARTPNFEPRRAPAIPGFIAAADAPLLFMPMRGAPEAQVTEWLGQLGRGGLITDFVQKTLRQWKRQSGAHRAFTVLRHPLARAHDGYCRAVLSGETDLYRLMTKAYGLDLPRGEGIAADAHHAGFLTFLRWLKIYLGGQTGQKIDPRLASQSAVLQGFAQFQTPDMVLREERLAEGLEYLASDLGITAPDLPPDASGPLPFALREIWDKDLEEAARDAYPRDYLGFGFGRWRG